MFYYDLKKDPNDQYGHPARGFRMRNFEVERYGQNVSPLAAVHAANNIAYNRLHSMERS